MTWCSTRSARAPSSGVGGCLSHADYLSTDSGPHWQNLPLLLVTPLLPGRSVLFGFPHHDQAMINRFGDLMRSGRFRPVIDRTYPLPEIAEAYRYVETGQKIGSVVITITHQP